MWPDIQQIFYLLVVDYATYVLAPLFLAGALLVAILMTLADYWRPTEKVEIKFPEED